MGAPQGVNSAIRAQDVTHAASPCVILSPKKHNDDQTGGKITREANAEWFGLLFFFLINAIGYFRGIN